MDELKAQGKEKTAAYRQYMGNRLMYSRILDLYKQYGENEIRRVLAVMPNGKTGAPCGACREFMAQLMIGKYESVEIMLDYEHETVVTLRDLTPEWWL